MYKVTKLSVGSENFEEYQINLTLTVDKYPPNILMLKDDMEKALNGMYEYPTGTIPTPTGCILIPKAPTPTPTPTPMPRQKAIPDKIVVEEEVIYVPVPDPEFPLLPTKVLDLPPCAEVSEEEVNKQFKETGFFLDAFSKINQKWFIKKERTGEKREALILDVVACLNEVQNSAQGKYVMTNLKSVMDGLKDARIQNAINNAGYRAKKA